MRTVTTNIYTYDELGYEAKKEARQWFEELEATDPGGFGDYAAARDAFFKRLNDAYMVEDNGDDYFDMDMLRDLLRDSKNMELTGYCYDAYPCELLGRMIEEDTINQYNREAVVRFMLDAIRAEWEVEVESRMQPEVMEEIILANDYEFYEDGTVFEG
jgi:hypothetical protein